MTAVILSATRSFGRRLTIERDGDSARCHATEEVSFSRTQGSEVTFPAIVSRESSEAVMCFDEVTLSSVVVIACQCFGKRCCLVKQTRHRIPFAVTADGYLHRIFRQFLTRDTDGITCCAKHHIGLREMQGFKRTRKVACCRIIVAEQTGVGVLDLVISHPRVIRRHTSRHGTAGLGQIEIQGYPVPALLDSDMLHFTSAGHEDNRFSVVAAIDIAMLEEDIATCCEIKDFTGRSLPELEANRLTVHIIVTINSDEGLGCVGDIVKGDIFFTDTLIAVERIDDIIRVGVIDRLIEHDLCADRHIERILAFIHTVVRRYRLYIEFDTERFAQSVFIGQIDHIRIKTYGYIGIERKRQRYLVSRFNRAAGCIY